MDLSYFGFPACDGLTPVKYKTRPVTGSSNNQPLLYPFPVNMTKPFSHLSLVCGPVITPTAIAIAFF